jgi:hypothetical protein
MGVSKRGMGDLLKNMNISNYYPEKLNETPASSRTHPVVTTTSQEVTTGSFQQKAGGGGGGEQIMGEQR